MLQKCNGVKISELDSRKSFTGSEYVVVADNEENYKIPIEQISDVVVDSSKFKAVVENVYTSSKPVADVTLDKGTFKFTFGIPPGEKGKDGKDGVDGIDGRDGLPGAPGKDGATGEATRVIIAYKSTRTTTKPDAPVGGGWDYNTNTPIYPTGWSNVDDNPNGYLWQSSATFTERGTMLIPWDGPFRLTGDDGSDGSDGSSIEFVYQRTATNLTKPYPTRPTGSQAEAIEQGWTDHPVGVDETMKCEWVSTRTKNLNTGQWSAWEPCTIWSTWGVQGKDGDGVEYIYYVGTAAPTSNLPSTWTNDANFQQNEYIRSGSGWTDNPKNIETYDQGYKQYVCVRKKQDGVWQAYSAPALWSYYSIYGKDGKSDAVVMNVVGNSKYIQLDSSKKNKAFSGQTTVQMYNNGNTISFTLSVVSLKDSTGKTYTNNIATVSGNTININISAGQLDFTDKYYILTIKGVPTTEAIAVNERQSEISLIGIESGTSGGDGQDGSDGEDGVSYQLQTTASTVRIQDGTYYPQSLGCSMLYSKGSTTTTYTPANTGGWTFSYSIDDGAWQTMSTATIATSGQNGIQFRAVKDSIVLSTVVPIIKSGTAGLDGISYSLELSNMSFTYTTAQDSDGTVTGYPFACTGLARVAKYEGKSKSYLSTSEVVIKTSLTGDSTQTTQSTVSGNAIKIDISRTLTTQNTVLAIFVYDTNGAIYVSTAVPVSASGKNGVNGKDGADAPGQTFAGSPLRMRGLWESGITYYDGKRATSDGAFYQDVVLYNNTYYACINTDSGTTDNWQTPPDGESVTWFAQFTLTEDQMINMLIANKAFIKELSTNEVVIFDDETVVAGMTSSKAIGEDSSLNGIVNDKGNVRIWAGEMQVSGDLTSAPFTVTDQGVVKSQGKNGTIILKDGTIYFIVNNIEYRLGITDGKPDWINDSATGSVAVQFYQLSQSGSYVTSTGGSANLLYLSDGKYYSSSLLTTLYSGTKYQFMSSSASPILLNNTYKLLGYNGKVGGEEIYRKVTFANGVMTAVGTVAIMYPLTLDSMPSGSSSVSITKNTAGKVWCSFEEVAADSTGTSDFLEGVTDNSGNAITATLVDSSNISFGTQATRDMHIYVLKAATSENVNTDLKYTDYSVNLSAFNYSTYKLENQSVA